jgi:oligoendopeptidase F
MMAASRVHAELWQALAGSRQRDHDAAETRLKNRIAELEQELLDRPKQVVERYVDRNELEEARQEADRAFRSRESATWAGVEVWSLSRSRETRA